MKKVYILKGDLKYDIPTDKIERDFYDLRMYINRKELKKLLGGRCLK